MLTADVPEGSPQTQSAPGMHGQRGHSGVQYLTKSLEWHYSLMNDGEEKMKLTVLRQQELEGELTNLYEQAQKGEIIDLLLLQARDEWQINEHDIYVHRGDEFFVMNESGLLEWFGTSDAPDWVVRNNDVLVQDRSGNTSVLHRPLNSGPVEDLEFQPWNRVPTGEYHRSQGVGPPLMRRRACGEDQNISKGFPCDEWVLNPLGTFGRKLNGIYRLHFDENKTEYVGSVTHVCVWVWSRGVVFTELEGHFQQPLKLLVLK